MEAQAGDLPDEGRQGAKGGSGGPLGAGESSYSFKKSHFNTFLYLKNNTLLSSWHVAMHCTSKDIT